MYLLLLRENENIRLTRIHLEEDAGIYDIDRHLPVSIITGGVAPW
jgi:hypothetical protein